MHHPNTGLVSCKPVVDEWFMLLFSRTIANIATRIAATVATTCSVGAVVPRKPELGVNVEGANVLVGGGKVDGLEDCVGSTVCSGVAEAYMADGDGKSVSAGVF